MADRVLPDGIHHGEHQHVEGFHGMGIFRAGEAHPIHPEYHQLQANGTSEGPDMGFRMKLILAVLFSLWSIAGSVLFWSMGFTPIETFYMMAQIVTTVGFGDLVPETQMQKLAVTGIVLASTLIVANAIMVAIDSFLDYQTAVLQKAMMQKEEQIKRDIEAKAESAGEGPERGASLQELGKENNDQEARSQWKQLAVNGALFCLFGIIGSVFFKLYEPCSCTYNGPPEEGCNPTDPGTCEDANGVVKTWIDCFYMSVVTLTTVGFGDHVAESPVGRLFAAFWMLFGVAVTVNFIGSFSDTLLSYKEGQARDKMTKAAFHEFDADGNGSLDHMEFLKLQLIKNGLATKEQIDSIDRQFNIIGGDDKLISMTEFAAYYMSGNGNN